MGQLFDASDRGEVGPLNELGAEIWGKDPLVSGLIGDRLAATAEVELQVYPNTRDPDQGRASELCLFVESWARDLATYSFEDVGHDRVPVQEGQVTEVLEAFSIPWYYALGLYWVLWDVRPGEPRPVPCGIELLDPSRYRLAALGSTTGEDGLYLETADAWQGRALRDLDPLRWFALRSSRPGQRTSLSGVARSLVFWWWLRINGAFAISRILEKFGVPNVIGVGSDPTGGAYTAEERAELDLFLQSYRSDVSALFPKNFTPQLVTVPPGSDQVAAAVLALTKSAITYGILGNEVSTTAQGAAASAGVAGGAGTSAERVEKRLILQDRRRAANGFAELARRAVHVWYGAEAALFVPEVRLLDPALATVNTTNPAPAPAAQAPQSERT